MCWRSGMSTVPVPRASSDRARRRKSASGLNSRVRAAANSIASGRPSRRRQISTTAVAFAAVRAKSWRAAPARSTNSATAGDEAISSSGTVAGFGGSGSGGTGYARSARNCNTVRLVARIATPGQRASSSSRSRAASTTCSRLSRMSSQRPSPKRSTTASSGESVPTRSAPTARPMPASTCSGSVNSASGTNTVPASNRSRSRSPAANANRVLPIPPDPVNVTSETSGRSIRPTTSSMACSRPNSDVAATGSGRRPPVARRRRPGGCEPLAQQGREVVPHQPIQLSGRAEGAVGVRLPGCAPAGRRDAAHDRAPAP